ncbi:Gfo/Idh/MocA family protein [candidate division KSB1 bacterium]
MASKKTYRLGIIGCGAVAKDFHLPAMVKNDRVEIAAAADVIVDRAREVAVRFEIPFAYSDYRELLAKTELDAVLVATPPAVIPEIVIDCLDSRLHVLAEKPIATGIEAGERLVKAAAGSDRVVQVGFIFRHSSSLERVREWVAAGKVGGPLVVRLGIFDEVWMGDVPEQNERLIGFLTEGSPMLMMGAHLADLANMIIPSRPIRVHGSAVMTRAGLPRANHWIGLVEYEDGSVAKLEVGWLHPLPRQEREKLLYPATREDEWEFFGEKAVVRYNFQTGGLRCAGEEELIEESYPPQELNFDRQLERFIASLDGERPLSPSLEDGLKSLTLTHTLQRAISEGRIIDLD